MSESRQLAMLAQDVARFYGADTVKAGVQVSFLGERAGWYAAVHRYPGDGKARVVAASARLDGFAETIENLDVLWKAGRSVDSRSEPRGIDDDAIAAAAPLRPRPARAFGSVDPQADILRAFGSELGNLVRNVGEFYAKTDAITGSVSLALVPEDRRGPGRAPFRPMDWYAAIHRFPAGAASRRVVAWAQMPELHQAVLGLVSEWYRKRNADPVAEGGRPFTEAMEAMDVSRASVLIQEPTRRIDLRGTP